MHWILQENHTEFGWDTLLETMKNFGFPYSEHKVVPFVGTLIPEPQIDHKNVICIGPYSMRHTAKKYGWKPGVFDIYDVNFMLQKIHWGELLLNHDSEVMEFRCVKLDKPSFIRPTHDTKFFAGKIFEIEEFHDWQKKVCEIGVDAGISVEPSTLVQVSSVKEIFSEYRFWIVKRKIVTASRYKMGNTVIYSNQVDGRLYDFVNSLITDSWVPHDAFVIDVADTPNGIKIVEINTLNSSGFYAGDIQKLVFELEYAFNEHGSRL